MCNLSQSKTLVCSRKGLTVLTWDNVSGNKCRLIFTNTTAFIPASVTNELHFWVCIVSDNKLVVNSACQPQVKLMYNHHHKSIYKEAATLAKQCGLTV